MLKTRTSINYIEGKHGDMKSNQINLASIDKLLF